MNFQGTKAIYLQIADYLIEQILIKNLQPLAKILSVREFAIQLEVNPNTVLRTYAYLEEKNILKRQRGVGYFVAEEAYRLAIKLKKDEFLQYELPQIMHTMQLLQIDMAELAELYAQYSHKQKALP
jgi:GntR family transcriptional regulator